MPVGTMISDIQDSQTLDFPESYEILFLYSQVCGTYVQQQKTE